VGQVTRLMVGEVQGGHKRRKVDFLDSSLEKEENFMPEEETGGFL
jgi:hypothetical protein